MNAEERIAALERRIATIEDEQAIARLLASYGPTVDTDDRERASLQWTPDGVYDTDLGHHDGRDAIKEMLAGPFHQGLLADGCAHLVSVCRIDLDGDRATATGYMSLIRRTGDTFTIVRQSAHRWSLIRDGDRWRVHDRLARLLDGREEARDVLRYADESALERT